MPRSTRPALPPALLALTALMPLSAPAQTDTGDARIRALEQRIEDRTRALKDEIEQLKQALETEKRRDAAPAGGPTDPEARALRSQLAETREQLNTLQSRMDQQGVHSRFTDGVVLEDPRGNWALRLSGRAQLDYRHFTDGGELVSNTFAVRRARLGAQVTLFKDYLVQVEGEFAGGDTGASATSGTPATVGSQTSQMTNGFLEYQRWPQARIRLGQFKPQFGLEQTLLDLQSDFMERALTQNVLDGNNINYDRGIMVHGAPFTPMYYALAVTNGNGQNRDERQANTQDARADGKDVTGRVVFDFARALAVPDTVLHAGVSYKTGTLTNSTATSFAPPAFRTEARGLTFFTPESLNGQTGVAAGDVRRRITAVEASASWKSLRLTGEWWLAQYDGTRTSPGAPLPYELRIQARYLSVLWLATGETWSDFYSGGFWQKVRPNNRFSLDPGTGWGAIELGARVSRMDASDFVPTTVSGAGAGRFSAGAPLAAGTNGATSLTLQVKWIHNPFSRLLVDYVRTNFDTPVSSANGTSTPREAALLARYQLDF